MYFDKNFNFLLSHSFFYNCKEGNTELVSKMIKDGIDINSQINGINSLHVSIMYNHIDIIKLLISNHANIEAESSDGFTPLMLATLKNNLDVVNMLLQNNANVNTKNHYGFTPLIIATIKKL